MKRDADSAEHHVRTSPHHPDDPSVKDTQRDTNGLYETLGGALHEVVDVTSCHGAADAWLARSCCTPSGCCGQRPRIAALQPHQTGARTLAMDADAAERALDEGRIAATSARPSTC